MNCQCEICVRMKRWKKAINPTTEEAKQAFDEMLTIIEGAETDAIYWEMKYKGI